MFWLAGVTLPEQSRVLKAHALLTAYTPPTQNDIVERMT